MKEPSPVLMDAKVRSMLRPKRDLSSSQMFEMKLGIAAVVEAVVKVRSPITVTTQVVSVVRSNLYHIVV